MYVDNDRIDDVAAGVAHDSCDASSDELFLSILLAALDAIP